MAEFEHIIAQVFDHSSRRLALLDADGNYVRVNQSYADYHCEPIEFFPGKNQFDLGHQIARELFDRARATKKPEMLQQESGPGCADESDWNLEPIPDSEGMIRYFLLSTTELPRGAMDRGMSRASADWCRCLSELSSDAMFVYENNEIFRFNHAAAALFGYTREEFGDQNLLSFVAPENRKQVIEKIAEQPDYPYETVGLHKNGSRIPVEVRAWTVSYTGKQARCVVIRDLTERQQAQFAVQKSEALFLQAARLAHLGHWGWSDEQNRMLEVSSEYTRILGRTKEEILSRHVTRAQESESIHPEDRDRYRATVADARRHARNYELEYRILKPGGEIAFVREMGEPVVDDRGKLIRWVGTLQDITRLKLTEIDLLAAKEEAEFANNAKSEFLARMSHELRTPLNAILGFGQLLELDAESLTNEQNEGVSHIIEGGRHLLHLIDDVLDIARIDSGSMDFSMGPLCLDQVLSESLLLVKPLAAKNGITMKLPDSMSKLQVYADERRLKQVLVNLLSNAVKYNRPDGSVKILIDTLEEGLVRIAIQDTGIGIKAEDETSLFEPFSRVSGTAQSVEGTGIGLAITKKLVDLMGGVIGFESEYGTGTTFFTVFPRAPDAAEPDSGKQWGERPVISDRLTNLNILCVEDIPINMQLMQQLILRITGNDLLCATNAGDGIELARRLGPDLILMDISLPDMDGFEALDVLKSDNRTAHIPVIAVTAHATHDQVEKAKETGFEHYLVKPVLFSQLVTVLDETVGAIEKK